MASKKKIDKDPSSFLAIADAHQECKLFNLPELEEDLRQDFRNAVDKAIELNVAHFIVVGDTYNDNFPTAETTAFVSSQVKKLRKNGINALAIAGDHDKPLDGKCWVTDINDFLPISVYGSFVGIDYNDDPSIVMKQLTEQYNDHTEFIFLHGMVRELWPFCDEKKLLPIKDWVMEHATQALKGIILGDIHKPFEDKLVSPKVDHPIFIGYCGSLGVTRMDELIKKGYLHYDGKELNRVEYTLERKFIEITLTPEWLDAMSATEKLSTIATLQENKKKPVVILKYPMDLTQRLNELAFLYEHAIVKPTRIKKEDSGQESAINIRSELKNDDKIGTTLRTIECIREESAYNLAFQLLTTPDEAKSTLDKFKEAALA